MLEDIWTVVWKERRSQFRVRGSRMRFLMTLLTPILLATIFPITWGPEWLAQVPPLIIATIAAVLLVAVMVPESFAGERERHTLETLLASRLPDRAILIGKLLVPLAVGWGTAILCLLCSLVVVNAAHGQGRILFFTPPIVLGSLALSLLIAGLTAGVGVFVSLRAATAQEASQILMAAILFPAMLMQLFPLLFREQFGQMIESTNGPQLLATILAVLVVLDAIVLLAAASRFQRGRLIAS